MAAQAKAKEDLKATEAAQDESEEEEIEEPTECMKQGKGCTWVIDAPSGPESGGVCKVCGAVRKFRNSFEYSSWYGSKNAGGRQPGRPRKHWSSKSSTST